MSETIEAVIFDREATALPDKNGNPVKVGDWIRDESGERWQVTALGPREATDDGYRVKRTGKLDRDYSTFRVTRYARHGTDGFVSNFVDNINYQGTIESGRLIVKAERIDLGEREAAELELEKAAILLANIERAQAILADKHRDAERQYIGALARLT